MFSAYKFPYVETEHLHGNNRYKTPLDFSTSAEAEQFCKNEFEKIKCSSCGGKRIKFTKRSTGKIINIYVKKVIFYDQVKEKTIFGKSKIVDKKSKVFWRVQGFESLKFVDVECKSCNNKANYFPNIKFLSLPLTCHEGIFQVLLMDGGRKMTRNDRLHFIENHLVKESIHNPFKIKKLFFYVIESIESNKRRIETVRDLLNNSSSVSGERKSEFEFLHEALRNNKEFLSDLGQVAISIDFTSNEIESLKKALA